MPERPQRSLESFRVVVGSTTIRSLLTTKRGTALALIELGSLVFFAAGIAARAVGPLAPYFLLAAVLLGAALRAVDVESCALFIPGGLYGTVRYAFGKRAAKLAAAALLVDYVVLGALAAVACGHAVAAAVGFLPRIAAAQQVPLNDVSTIVAVTLVGAAWLWLRQGRLVASVLLTRTVGLAIAVLAAVVAIGVVGLMGREDAAAAIAAPWQGLHLSPVAVLMAFAACLFAAGSPDGLSQSASDFPQPKIYHLRRAARLATVYSLVFTAGIGFLLAWLLPDADRVLWADTPVEAVLLYAGLPRLVSLPLVAIVVAVSVAFLGLTIYRSAGNAQQLLLRLSEDGVLAGRMRVLHRRFGTPYRLIDLVAIVQLGVIVAGAGQLAWLSRAYGIALACAVLCKIAALVRLRTVRSEPRVFRVPVVIRVAGREWAIGLGLVAALVGIPAALLLVIGDAPSLTAFAGVVACAALLSASERANQSSDAKVTDGAPETDLLPPVIVGSDQMNVRRGNILVGVRKPGVLAHLAAALQAAGDRDVVVMTVRLLGVDVSDELSQKADTTDEEQRLLSGAALLAERLGHEVKLLIVPATNVFDAVAETAVHLRSAEVYVGESETLAADDQARLLGDAWERAPKPEFLDVRLVIHHSSGRRAVYHLGAHAPSLTTDDFQLIHSLWLDVVKAVGPRVHHHDVVRAALKHMEEQLHNEGPPRDAVLAAVRQIARPADELAAAVHDRDFARLRDMVRNRPPSDLAAVFTDMALEDQVVTFRVLPRKVAAATFEYLSHEAQASLLKAMAQEDVASLLNNMAPDDRTMFLEELPAAATQQLLSLLKPDERTIALTLLGYPEHSIGRLMTPDYIAVREQWTVQEVLDYVRTHGQDSETLNVIYVVDDHGLLIDDIRIRELLLAPPTSTIAQLMDRRFVALNAADDQKTAVTVFRREDRSALPVTDSTGVLIGIVTIDDVLDVAEAVATNEIQRIGGSEALDEPYMRIAFTRMIQKRAGWLTALFLGEMLTATAMGAFEHEIEKAVVLALFVPLIISSGGNSGSQASTLVIRAIALGEVQLRDWWQVMRREIGAGLALGSILGSIGFLRITLWSAFSDLYGPHWLLVAVTVALALVGVVLWGTLVGSLLPFLLRRLGFDPATSSAPFVATLVDVTGLIIYFSVGLLTLRGTLL